jgi:hypothetical protein
LYPDVQFPGSHYTYSNGNGGFTFSEFIDANIEAFDGNIFVGGKINYHDDSFSKKFEQVPLGMVQRVEFQERASSRQVESYRQESLETWIYVSNLLATNLPNKTLYPQSTWEWTIGREFFDHMVRDALLRQQPIPSLYSPSAFTLASRSHGQRTCSMLH